MALRLQNMRDRIKTDGFKLCPIILLKDIDFIEPPPEERLEEKIETKVVTNQATLLNYNDKLKEQKIELEQKLLDVAERSTEAGVTTHKPDQDLEGMAIENLDLEKKFDNENE